MKPNANTGISVLQRIANTVTNPDERGLLLDALDELSTRRAIDDKGIYSVCRAGKHPIQLGIGKREFCAACELEHVSVARTRLVNDLEEVRQNLAAVRDPNQQDVYRHVIELISTTLLRDYKSLRVPQSQLRHAALMARKTLLKYTSPEYWRRVRADPDYDKQRGFEHDTRGELAHSTVTMIDAVLGE